MLLNEATRTLLLAMRAHGIDQGRTEKELTDRATLIASAACETAPTHAVVLIKGSKYDAERLADAVEAGIPRTGDVNLDGKAVDQEREMQVRAANLTEAIRVIERMVEAGHRG
jgi:hypothetical protein